MTLWNLIRDFFVQNIFGGTLSTGGEGQRSYVGKVFDGTSSFTARVTDLFVPIGNYGYVGSSSIREVTHITLGDWLSTTATIITLALLTMFLYLFVKWIFKVFSGLLR